MTNLNMLLGIFLCILAASAAGCAVYMLIVPGHSMGAQAFGVGSAVFCFLLTIFHMFLSVSPAK